ncbi:hypothetical protein [Frateuria sp.]|uniref:hypothetical protein n=1 Tax=Frateuria sp. TaxID=2211372 RepID=UPI0017D5F654|nr:hypothetical protein [Frateuria sp.]NUR21433.1 hypothetical protein [Frateuria sp.]
MGRSGARRRVVDGWAFIAIWLTIFAPVISPRIAHIGRCPSQDGVFSLNGGLRPGHGLILSAGIDNLLDKVYAEHINAAVEGLAGYGQRPFASTSRAEPPGSSSTQACGPP